MAAHPNHHRSARQSRAPQPQFAATNTKAQKTMPHLHASLNSPVTAHSARCPSFVFFNLRIAFSASSLFSHRSALPYVFSNYPTQSTASHRPLPYFQQLTNPSHPPSINIFFILKMLQAPLPATPFFSHLYKTPGCHPSTLTPRNSFGLTGTMISCPASANFKLSLAVLKSPTYNPPLASIHSSGSHHGHGQEE